MKVLNVLKWGLNGSVVPGCSTGVMLVFRWYSGMYSATVSGCSVVPPVFRVPAFLVLQYAAIWKVVTALCVKSMRPFHYIMQCPHCVMRFLVWLCVLFMGLYFYIIWFWALTIRLDLKKIRFCTLFILLSFGYELFLFGYGLFSFSYGFFKYALFI